MAANYVRGAFGDVLGPGIVAAFKSVYEINNNTSFVIEMGCDDCTGLARTIDPRAQGEGYYPKIKFRGFYANQFSNISLVIHELFHALENTMKWVDENDTQHTDARESLPGGLSNNRDGLANEPRWTWQHSTDNTPGEIFADIRIGWVFN